MRPHVRRKIIFTMIGFNAVLAGTFTFFGCLGLQEVLVVTLAPTGLSCASLLGVWVALGIGPVLPRIAGAAFAITFLATCWHLARQLPMSSHDVTGSLSLFLLPAMTLGLTAWLLRSMGLRIITRSGEQETALAGEPRFLQFSLREILLLPAAAAIVLAVVQNLLDSYQAKELAVICLACLVQTLVCLWLCLGKTARYRVLVAIPLIGLTALSSYRFEGGAVVAVLGITGTCTIAALVVVRFCGYRLVVSRRSTGTADMTAENVPASGNALLL